jgi:hypothetical protein
MLCKIDRMVSSIPARNCDLFTGSGWNQRILFELYEKSNVDNNQVFFFRIPFIYVARSEHMSAAVDRSKEVGVGTFWIICNLLAGTYRFNTTYYKYKTILSFRRLALSHSHRWLDRITSCTSMSPCRSFSNGKLCICIEKKWHIHQTHLTLVIVVTIRKPYKDILLYNNFIQRGLTSFVEIIHACVWTHVSADLHTLVCTRIEVRRKKKKGMKHVSFLHFRLVLAVPVGYWRISRPGISSKYVDTGIG